MPPDSDSVAAPRFDSSAQDRIAALFRHCPTDQFIQELSAYTPADRDEEAGFEKYYGWALEDAGDFEQGLPHLLRALRRSRPGSADRAHVRGLLGQHHLRTGNLTLAERCSQRALADLPAKDDGGYLRAGHLNLLGRIYRRQGHLTHAIETYRRGLALLDQRSPHLCTLTANLSYALILRGQIHEADALIRVHRDAFDRGVAAGQDWLIAVTEAHVSLALGEIDRAEQIVGRAFANPDLVPGTRPYLVLMEWRVAILLARKQWVRAEESVRAMLDCCALNARNSDMIASSARALAEALEGQGRLEDALESARLAIRAGGVEDRAEWATGLHVLGRCLAILGRSNEARRAFQEALSLHERSEFQLERKRLEGTLNRLGMADLTLVDRATASGRGSVPRRNELLRASLTDGRSFLTLNQRLLDDIRQAAVGDLPVLLEGETGTGKELVAHLLHDLGPLAGAPFVVVDCATLSAELADAELFGAARGAYTGAHRDRQGLVGRADGGTLFLDELPELSHALQAKLLRVLQDGTYRRVGEDSSRKARVRFVAATNRSVDELLRSGALKPDLFYRLNGHRLALVPLRNRKDEIGALADEIVNRCGLAGLTPAAHRALEAYRWPGNVRQLEMILRVACGRCEPGSVLHWEDLILHEPDAPASVYNSESLRAGRVAWERTALVRALHENGGVVAKAARSLGMSRQAFYLAMRRTGLNTNGALEA